MLKGNDPDRGEATGMNNGQGPKSFPARTQELHNIRSFIRERGERASLPADLIRDLVLAVSEACANSALHSGSDETRVQLNVGDDRVECIIEDSGVFSRRIPVPELGHRGGRGIPLMMALMDEFAIREGNEGDPGTLIRLVKYAA
jgi:anti-sigma regulatory factor (Ser/Thr protein kinase)